MCKSINVTFKKISPEMAQEIIDNSNEVFAGLETKQRKIREATVAMYAADMENGKWDEGNAETIKLSSEGAIIDGQHRLRAVILSKKTLGFYVAEGMDIKSISTVDIGLKRSLENTLQLLGKSYETGAAAIVRQKLTYDKHNKSMGASDTSLKITRVSQVEEYEKNNVMYDYISQFSKKIYKASEQALSSSEVGAIYAYLYLTLGKDKEIIEDFFTQLAQYSNGSKSIFGVTYRNLKDKKRYKSTDRTKEYIACWNSFISKRRTIRDTQSDWFE